MQYSLENTVMQTFIWVCCIYQFYDSPGLISVNTYHVKIVVSEQESLKRGGGPIQSPKRSVFHFNTHRGKSPKNLWVQTRKLNQQHINLLLYAVITVSPIWNMANKYVFHIRVLNFYKSELHSKCYCPYYCSSSDLEEFREW